MQLTLRKNRQTGARAIIGCTLRLFGAEPANTIYVHYGFSDQMFQNLKDAFPEANVVRVNLYLWHLPNGGPPPDTVFP